ncbi:hypothetical protein DBR17_15785 [Sphingomonas sp. HMWF008]|nr:hypothetical protein DBR17_15785 [Sphingomonas sp. HMWF008]
MIAGTRPAVLMTVKVVLDGLTPSTRRDAERFLDALDVTDEQRDIDKLMEISVKQVWSDLCEERLNRIAEVLPRPDWREKLEKSLGDLLKKLGLSIRSVRIHGTGHAMTHVDLENSERPLSVKCLDEHSVRRFFYSTRLVWSEPPRHQAAQSLYLGRVYRDPGTPPREIALGGMRDPLVPGQFEPLEAWFEHLLQEEMRAMRWTDLEREIETGCPKLQAELSELLGAGTGRRIETLQVKHLRDDGIDRETKTFKFENPYPISGLSQRMLKIEHDIKYHLADPDVWASEKSPDPEPRLRELIILSTRSVLHGWTFGQIVDSYRAGRRGDDRLSSQIKAEVGGKARLFGFEVDALSSIGVLNDRELIAGRKIDIPLKRYDLMDSGLKLDIEVNATVSVGTGEDNYDKFARSIQSGEGLDERIADHVERAVRETLRKVSGYQYFTSSFVSALPTHRRHRDQLNKGGDIFRQQIHDAIDEDLAREFGLRLTTLDLISAEEDPYVKRMNELNSLDLEQENQIDFRNAHEPFAIHVKSRIKIQGIAPDHWTKFAPEVHRRTVDEHLQMIRTRIADGMSTFQHVFSRGSRENLTPDQVQAMVIDKVVNAIEQECGLEAVFSKFDFKIELLEWARLAQELESNDAMTKKLRDQRLTGLENQYDDDEHLTKRIRKLQDERKEIVEAMKRAPTTTYSFQQNTETGQIVGSWSHGQLEAPAASHKPDHAPANGDPDLSTVVEGEPD